MNLMMRHGLLLNMLVLLLLCAPPAQGHTPSSHLEHIQPQPEQQSHVRKQQRQQQQQHDLYLPQEGEEEREDDFPDSAPPDLEALHDFAPTLPSTSAVLYTHFTRAVRSLMGSNCVLIERGEVPIYEQCYGCSMREAFACLQDMRNNVTGNVAVGCHIEAISEAPDTSCCPEYLRYGGGRFSPVLFESSAYPMALECLREVGCADTEIFSNLAAECYRVCDSVKNLYNNDIEFTCTAIPNPAAVLPPPSLATTAGVSLSLLLALHVLY